MKSMENNIKLTEAELKLMEIIWERYPITAKDVNSQAGLQYKWKKSTVYTILGKLVDKKAVRRDEPDFACTPLVSKEEVRRGELNTLIDRFCGSSVKTFLSAFIHDAKLSKKEIEELRQLIDAESEE